MCESGSLTLINGGDHHLQKEDQQGIHASNTCLLKNSITLHNITSQQTSWYRLPESELDKSTRKYSSDQSSDFSKIAKFIQELQGVFRTVNLPTLPVSVSLILSLIQTILY